VPGRCVPGWQLRGRGATAGAEDPLYIRMGTSGGIGTDAGTVVVATEGVDGLLRPVRHARAPWWRCVSICTLGFPFFPIFENQLDTLLWCCAGDERTGRGQRSRAAERESGRDTN
jgi:hypothetical protein